MNTLKDYEARPMRDDESRFLVQLSMCGEIPFDEVLAMPMCKLINNRFPEGFEVDSKLLLLVGDLAQGNPAHGVMLAFTLYKNNIHNLDEVVNVFPYGWPTDEAYNQMWDSQKIPWIPDQRTDNLLDRPDTWK